MDKKIKTALVSTAAAFMALSAQQVSADETSNQPVGNEATESESLKQVTDTQVSDAEKKVTETKEIIEQKEISLKQAEADAKQAIENEKAAAEIAKEATPANIQKAKVDATKASIDTDIAKADINAKKATRDALAKDVATKQSEIEKANADVQAATKKVQDLENGVPSLVAAEEAKAKAAIERAEAEKAKEAAEKAKDTAKAADEAAAKNLAVKENDLTIKKQALAEKEKALKDLGEAPQGYDFSDVKFNLGADFAAALNERAKLMGENDPNNTGDGRANELSTRNQAEVTANAEKLKQLAKTNMAKNTYTNTTDKREVDIWNLTADQKREINLFGLHIVNQIREQLGNPKVKTTVGMEKFANEAADARNKKYAKVTETYAKPDYDGINVAAKANGLSYKTGENQNQSDIIFANAKTFQKTEDSEVFKSAQNLNTLMQNSTRRPKMTMGQLKEYIFEAYNSKMFTNNEDYTGANSHRAWENALSIGGSIAFRKDGKGNKLGRKASEYNATSVTASVRFNPNPYVNQRKEYRYFTNLEIFVHNFQTAGENKAVGQERNSIVTDPSKFDATEIKNDPTAAKEYSAKKQAAEKAVNDAKADVTKAQNNLETAKQYKAQLPAAEKALTDATNKLTVAEKALTDAEAKLNNLRQDATNRADELNKAKAALATAKQAAEKAKATLTVAQTKLAKAEKDVQATASLVMTKVAAKDQAEELVRSLENAAKALELAKVAKKNADAKVEELHKSLAEKQTELVKFEEEYKKLLKQYISTLTQPENPELNFYEEVKEEDIKFNIVEELDSSLKEGERVVKLKGINGRKKVKTIVFKSSGEEVGRIVDSEEVLEKPVDEIILVGTKKENLPVPPLHENPGDKKLSGDKTDDKKISSVKPEEKRTAPRDVFKDEKKNSNTNVSKDVNKILSESQSVYMAPKVKEQTVGVANTQKLPRTGVESSKASIVLAISVATTSLGLVAIKKKEK
ncbi:SEC10/PgrA surface exclusion domain-containing protein [Streptococcus sp. 27098_8_73]|uniref:SEC10/PgrA surface exclusion domain-containing protein n=1 Tax=Streptococcus sp. 27098_8_73 TaxID=3003668 RepID=UPI00352E7B6A